MNSRNFLAVFSITDENGRWKPVFSYFSALKYPYNKKYKNECAHRCEVRFLPGCVFADRYIGLVWMGKWMIETFGSAMRKCRLPIGLHWWEAATISNIPA